VCAYVGWGGVGGWGGEVFARERERERVCVMSKPPLHLAEKYFCVCACVGLYSCVYVCVSVCVRDKARERDACVCVCECVH